MFLKVEHSKKTLIKPTFLKKKGKEAFALRATAGSALFC